MKNVIAGNGMVGKYLNLKIKNIENYANFNQITRGPLTKLVIKREGVKF